MGMRFKNPRVGQLENSVSEAICTKLSDEEAFKLVPFDEKRGRTNRLFQLFILAQHVPCVQKEYAGHGVGLHSAWHTYIHVYTAVFA